MKPIDTIGPKGVASRAAVAGGAPVTAAEPAQRHRPEAPVSDGPALSLSTSSGAAPVDAERVATIRRAIEDGRYPIIPMKVADAMIAAGLLLRTK